MRNRKIYIFNPLSKDPLSKYRGLGRYTRILLKALPEAEVLSADLSSDLSTAILVFPYWDFLKKPFILKRLAKTQVLVVHDLIKLKYPEAFPLGLKSSFFLFLNKLLVRQIFDFVITDTEAVKKDIVNVLKIPSSKVFVAPPAVEEVFFKRERLKKENFCLYVGDATYNKNLLNMAKAIVQAGLSCVLIGKVWERKKLENLLKNSHPELKPLREFWQFAKDKPNFVLKGFLSDEELRRYYARARLNLLLSFDEGFGYSPLEAGLQFTPSLVSDIPVFRETLQDSAFYSDPFNWKKMAEVMRKIFYNQKELKAMGEKAYKRASLYNLSNFRKQLLKVFQTIK